MSFTVGGIVSGIDTQSLVDALVQAERIPIDRLQVRQSGFQDKISALQDLNTLLSALQTSVEGLTDDTSPFLSRVATSLNGEVATVSATDTAPVGSYLLEVTSLAKAQTLVSVADRYADTDTTQIGTGTLTVAIGTGTPTEITIDSSNNTLAGIRDAINAADAGITASIVNDGAASPYRLVITASDTGTDNLVTLAVVGDGDGNDTDDAGLSQLTNANLSEIQAASDAQITVNNIPIISSTNTVADAIPGTTLELLAETDGTPVQISVSETSGPLEEVLAAFVDNFNKIASFDAKQNNLATPGPLAGDFTLRSVSSRLSTLVLAFGAHGEGALRALSDIGVRMGDGGRLQFDKSVFHDAVQSDPDAVERFIRGDGDSDKGFFGDFLTAIEGFTDPITGAIHGRKDGLSANIKRINQQIDLAEVRIIAFEKRVTAQFSNLELLLNDIQTQGTALINALASLPAIQTTQGN
jgi:flagellar hook-associated protein 2